VCFKTPFFFFFFSRAAKMLKKLTVFALFAFGAIQAQNCVTSITNAATCAGATAGTDLCDCISNIDLADIRTTCGAELFDSSIGNLNLDQFLNAKQFCKDTSCLSDLGDIAASLNTLTTLAQQTGAVDSTQLQALCNNECLLNLAETVASADTLPDDIAPLAGKARLLRAFCARPPAPEEERDNGELCINRVNKVADLFNGLTFDATLLSTLKTQVPRVLNEVCNDGGVCLRQISSHLHVFNDAAFADYVPDLSQILGGITGGSIMDFVANFSSTACTYLDTNPQAPKFCLENTITALEGQAVNLATIISQGNCDSAASQTAMANIIASLDSQDSCCKAATSRVVNIVAEKLGCTARAPEVDPTGCPRLEETKIRLVDVKFIISNVDVQALLQSNDFQGILTRIRDLLAMQGFDPEDLKNLINQVTLLQNGNEIIVSTSFKPMSPAESDAYVGGTGGSTSCPDGTGKYAADKTVAPECRFEATSTPGDDSSETVSISAIAAAIMAGVVMAA
jgi:hypothetical protein